MANREAREQETVKRTLQDLLHTAIINDRTQIILRAMDNKTVGKGRRFEDHILAHMHDGVNMFMRVGANTILVHLDN